MEVQEALINANDLVQFIRNNELSSTVTNQLIEDIKNIRNLFNKYNHSTSGLSDLYDMFADKGYVHTMYDDVVENMELGKPFTVQTDTEHLEYEQTVYTTIKCDIWNKQYTRGVYELGELIYVEIAIRGKSNKDAKYTVFANDFVEKLKGSVYVDVIIDGYEAKQRKFAYDGCHKIYLLTDEQVKEAEEIGYEIHPISEIERIYVESCPLKFINTWGNSNETIKTIIPQGIAYKPVFIFC